MSATPAESLELRLPDAAATQRLGQCLARSAPSAAMVYLHGGLGVGKTTLVRSLVQALGHDGAVRSPSYTLMEPYSIANAEILHMDLYRLADAQELDFLGLEDIEFAHTLVLIEWPQQGSGRLPAADLELTLHMHGEGRLAQLQAGSHCGREWLGRAQNELFPQ